MVQKSSRDPDADLAMLRERLGWYEEIPALEHVHVMAIEAIRGHVILCCHDSANANKQALMFEATEKGDLAHVFNEEGELTEEIKVTCAHVIRAAYN